MGPIASLVANDLWFWVNFIIPIAIGLYMLITHSKYILQEFGIQVGVSFVVVTIAFVMAYTMSTDMYQVNYWNSKVSQFVYEEPWEEEYDCSYESCDSEGKNCVTIPKTCYTDHWPQYYLHTAIGETVSISKENFRTASREFGSKEEDVYRSGQTSSSKVKGEGDIWRSYPDEIIPTAVGHNQPNYVRLQMKNVIHDTFSKEELASPLLKPYPKITYNKYGGIHLNRVILSNAKVDSAYIKTMQKRLELMAVKYGSSKEVNPMVYLVDTEDLTFKYLLDAYYEKAHKNDSILVLSISEGKVVWSDVIAWTENAGFLMNNTTVYTGLTDPNKIMDLYEKEIVNGWDRTEMKTKEYLARNIDLDWWVYLIVFLVNVGASAAVFYMSLDGQWLNRRKFRRYR